MQDSFCLNSVWDHRSNNWTSYTNLGNSVNFNKTQWMFDNHFHFHKFLHKFQEKRYCHVIFTQVTMLTCFEISYWSQQTIVWILVYLLPYLKVFLGWYIYFKTNVRDCMSSIILISLQWKNSMNITIKYGHKIIT